jgi:putative FmdB family regulatory protein
MPIYEFLCQPCNRVYSFHTQRYDTERVPACPKCGSDAMRRMVSRFAFVRGGTKAKAAAGDEDLGGPGGGFDDEPGGPGGGPDLDDPRVEREMMKLMADAEHMDENDPRQLARLMRRMSEVTGEPLDAEMEDAVRRLESGEDPERVEEDMGGLGLGPDDGGYGGPPAYDDDLYSF